MESIEAHSAGQTFSQFFLIKILQKIGHFSLITTVVTRSPKLGASKNEP